MSHVVRRLGFSRQKAHPSHPAKDPDSQKSIRKAPVFQMIRRRFLGISWAQCSGRIANSLKILVGAGRFELPTPCSRSKCATRLRYAPPDRNPPRDAAAGAVVRGGSGPIACPPQERKRGSGDCSRALGNGRCYRAINSNRPSITRGHNSRAVITSLRGPIPFGSQCWQGFHTAAKS